MVLTWGAETEISGVSKGKGIGELPVGSDAWSASEGRMAGPRRSPWDELGGDNRAKLSQRKKFIRTAHEARADETGALLSETLRAVGWARKH